MATTSPRPELVGASEPAIALAGATTTSRVTFQEPARLAATARLGGARPVKAFLNFENVTGSGLHGSYEVYINVPSAGASPPGPAPLLAGHLSTFGVRKASRPDSPHGGSGITTVLEITKLIEQLHHERGWDGHHLDVTLVHKVPPGGVRGDQGSDLQIGRVSVYYG